MRVGIALLFLLTVLQFAAGASSEQVSQKIGRSLDELLVQIPTVAAECVGWDAQAKLAGEIQAFGPKAVPHMIRLFKSDDLQVRYFAGYVISDLDGITAEHLDILIEEQNRDGGYLAPAIGRIGTPKAVAFLVDHIRHNPINETQVTRALVIAGEKAIPALVDLFRSKEPISRELLRVICEVYTGMGAKAASVLPRLLEIAEDERLNPQNRASAVIAMGSQGVAASSVVPDLKRLAAGNPALFRQAVEESIINMKIPESADIYASRLASEQGDYYLYDIAELGVNGRRAGPEVIKLLRHQKWNIRAAAARTLGYIGYTESSDELMLLLRDQDDWSIVYFSAEALGRMKVRAAIPELQRVAASHWLPVVREAAGKAVRVIEGEVSNDFLGNEMFFTYVPFTSDRPAIGAKDKATTICSDGVFLQEREVMSTSELKETLSSVGGDEKGNHVRSSQELPACGFHVERGNLLGYDHGEWGGNLVFSDKAGKRRVILGGNTHGIHRMPFGVVAVVGSVDFPDSLGYLYIIETKCDVIPQAKRWKSLPGAPVKSGILKNGDLLVSCAGGLDVVVTPEGALHMAEESER